MLNLYHSSSVLVAAVLFLIATAAASASRPVYSVTNYGARADPKTDSTTAFLDAWSRACSDPRPSTVYVPNGKFYIRNATFEGPCRSNDTLVRVDGTLVAPADYSVIGDAGNWILFHSVDGVRISGGILDGQGIALWSCKLHGQKKDCPLGATNLHISNSNNVTIDGLTSTNSQMFHIAITGCRNVNLQRVTVTAPGSSPNTDGIHVGLSTLVSITNSTISTGDDCISMGPGARNVWIERVACGPGHGISIGSLGWTYQEPGVENVTVKTVNLTETTNGLRIKTWGRPSSGFVRDVLFQHAVMEGVQNPILIDQNYCPGNRNCPGRASGVEVSDVRYWNVRGTSRTEVAVRIDCSKANPCSGIQMRDVALAYVGSGSGSASMEAAAASCTNARGTSLTYVTPVVKCS
ncbi:unnamed protein product [Linum tenue]|uniref:Polygalacturonase n=1 Tax=Linum tenue TaxID=586396 RepID=A0AAV0H5W5_9ROSI|nr:unnamed protein product [Linum tenue]